MNDEFRHRRGYTLRYAAPELLNPDISVEPGVDYYTDVFSAGLFEEHLTCPESGGAYTIFLNKTGSSLVITCHDHGDNHRQ